MRNFKVPKSMVQTTLAGMLGGESAYTVPWALLVANDRSATLNVDMPAYTQPGGTISMYVTRVGAKEWTVDLSKVPNDYVFTTSPHKSEHQVVQQEPVMSADPVQTVTEALAGWPIGYSHYPVQVGVGAARDMAAAAVNAARPAIEREAKAAAWDEGFADGLRQDGEGDDGPRYVNPYRSS